MVPLLDEVKLSRRMSTSAYDEQLNGLIQAAEADMALLGIKVDEADPLIRRAVITYCLANFGSPQDYTKLKESYDEQKAQLKTSSRYKGSSEGGENGSGRY